MTWAVGDLYHPDLAHWPGPVENLAEIATEVTTSALKCSEWRWVRAR